MIFGGTFIREMDLIRDLKDKKDRIISVWLELLILPQKIQEGEMSKWEMVAK